MGLRGAVLRALVRLTLLRLWVLLSPARDVDLRFAAALVIGISFQCAATIAVTTEAPPQRSSRRGRLPKRMPAPGTGHSTALSARRSQSFLDNLIAGLGRLGAAKDQTCDARIAADDVRFRG